MAKIQYGVKPDIFKYAEEVPVFSLPAWSQLCWSSCPRLVSWTREKCELHLPYGAGVAP